MKLVIVSGRSGSGKSVALRVLEDLGYYCVDNLPLSMITDLLEQLSSTTDQVAISVDVRNLKDQDKVLEQQLSSLVNTEITSFFLHSSDTVLLKRYSETRRLHPLSKNHSSLQEAIKLEGQLLSPLSTMMDHFVDTSQLNVYQLTDHVRQILMGNVT